jgi:hypothetical protein
MTPDIRDEEGQPPRPYYAERVEDRLVAELLGVCKGLSCDGVLLEEECQGLKRWLVGHPDAVVGYLGREVAERVLAAYQDGSISEEERIDLYDFMCSLTGETPEANQPMNLTTRHFFDEPAPPIVFTDREFVFTGRMLYGTRRACERAVELLGGTSNKVPRSSSDYLVVGPIASAAWIQSTHGTKLLSAAEIRERGGRIRIVTEEHWVKHINPPALRII